MSTSERKPAGAWRSTWRVLSPPVRFLFVVVGSSSLVGAVILGGRLLPEDPAFVLSSWLFAFAPLGSGLLIVLTGRLKEGRERWAWLVIGSGVALWGLGDLIWVWDSFIRGVEIPYPGPADIFYVLAYPALFVGVLLLPHLRPGKWERVRLTLDVIAGTVALVSLLWVFYLQDGVSFDPDVGWLEQVLDTAYAISDGILVVALMMLITRRSTLRFDGRLVALGAGTVVTTYADIVFVFQDDAGTFVDGGWLDGVWLVGYGLFALAAFLVAHPTRLRDEADHRTRVWQMIPPYAAIIALFAANIAQLGSQANFLQIAATAVAGLILGRQAVAIRETREVVERQRSDLVASISHELRTPLTAVSGFLEIVRQSPDLAAADRIEMMDIIADQTDHMTRIIGDLVDVARGDLEATDLDLVSVEVQSLVASAVDMLPERSTHDEIAVSVPEGLNVLADEDRLLQCLVNYLTNADRYGRSRISVVACAENARVTIEVHDDGPGVPAKYRSSVWDRFERGANRYLSHVQGSGLGLAIVGQLVHAHGGDVGYRQSDRLGGACFWLSVPGGDVQEPSTTTAEAAGDTEPALA